MNKLISMFTVLSAATVFAVAEPEVVTLNFETTGPDTYKDGEAVKAGEIYALVWSADGEFDGVKADGTTVDAADRIVYKYSTEAEGRCTAKTIQISTALTYDGVKAVNGKFAIYIFDTRKFTEAGTVTVGAANPVAYASPATGEVTITSKISDATATEAVAANEATVLPDVTGELKIANIEVGADQVTLTLEGASQYGTYVAAGGTTPDADTTLKTQTGATTLIVPKPADGQGFFKVNRK